MRALSSCYRKFVKTMVQSRQHYHDTNIAESMSNEPEEVKVPVPWGHIAGKWWGRKDVRPIIGIHGWQDNCGTFDTLAPLLPKHVGFLAIDLPGHGLSSRIPDGMMYNNFDNIVLLQMICKKYKWDKMSILGHSMGSVMGFIYGGVFPENIDMLIQIDVLVPAKRSADKFIRSMKRDIENFIISDERNRNKSEPPSYTREDLIRRMHEGSSQSVSLEAAKFMITRGIAKSEFHPDNYYFSRDARLKSNISTLITYEIYKELAKNMKFPHCVLKATHSPFDDKLQCHLDMVEFMQKNNPKFEYHSAIEGTHHLHLNDPESVIDIINNFINKHRPEKETQTDITSKL